MDEKLHQLPCTYRNSSNYRMRYPTDAIWSERRGNQDSGYSPNEYYADRLTNEIDALGHVTTYYYDPVGIWLDSTTPPFGGGQITCKESTSWSPMGQAVALASPWR